MQATQSVRRQSTLQKIKNEERSAIMSNKKFMPNSYDRLKELQQRKQALNFMNSMIENRVRNKSEFCKQEHISHHTLNDALEQLGMHKKRVERKSKGSVANSSRNKPIRAKKKRIVSAGMNDEDEEIESLSAGSVKVHDENKKQELCRTMLGKDLNSYRKESPDLEQLSDVLLPTIKPGLHNRTR